MTTRSERGWVGLRYGRLLEYGYVTILLSALTTGSVTFLWSNTLAVDATHLPDAVQWTFVLLQLPALILLAHRVDSRPPRVVWMLVAFVGWLTLSVTWSVLPAVTLTAATSLVLTCGVGIYLAYCFSWLELTVLVFVAMQPGLMVSRLAIARAWPGALDVTGLGGDMGIYGNRNSLGPPAVFAVACGIVLIARVLSGRTRSRSRVWLVILLLPVVVFDLDLQHRGESTTSWLMLATFLGTVVALAVVQTIPSFVGRPSLGVTAGRMVILGCAAAFALAVAFNDEVSQAFGRPPGFHRRVDYWVADLEGVKDKLIVGWGWMAAWRSEEFRATLTPYLATDVWSHSAYLDVALGGGAVAIVLLITVGVAGTRSAGEVLDRADPCSAVPLALVTSIAVGCTEESFFVGNYFLTALVVAGLCAAFARRPGLEPDVEATVVTFRSEPESPVGGPSAEAAQRPIGDGHLRTTPG